MGTLNQSNENIMQDIIHGLVTSVIDGDTFIINVTETSNTSQYNYNTWERIRIINLDSSEFGSLGGFRDKVNLERALQGKKVSCSVQTKDTFGRIVADVKII